MNYLAILFLVLGQALFSNLANAADSEWSSNIREIHVDNAIGLNFDRRKEFDLNNDGVKDVVSCTPSQWITIKSGKDNRTLFSWSGPSNKYASSYRRYLSGCEIVKVGSRHAVLISNHSRWRSNGWLKTADQYVVYFDGTRFIWDEIDVEGVGKYSTSSRRINCHSYPEKLVELGYAPGALCFNSDYAADERSRSALLKLEFSGNRLIFKDLSKSSGSMWSNGVRGTDIYRFRVGSGFKSNQRDGAFMMGSAFLDFDGDDVVDFVTVGQHASVRAHKITIDTSRAEGIRVSDSYIHVTSAKTLSELLNVKAFNNFDERIKIPCIYTSGEGHEGGLASEGDRMYCYSDGQWVRKNLPRVLSSQYANAQIRPAGNGRMYIKVENRRSNNSVISHHLFDFYFVNEIDGSAWAWTSSSKLHLGGHACRQNGSRDISVKSYEMPLWSRWNTMYRSSEANQSSGVWVQAQCMATEDIQRNYRQDVWKSALRAGSKRAVYNYAFDSVSGTSKLIGVSTYDKLKDGRVINVKSLPMDEHDSLTVSWTNRGSQWSYSLDIVDQFGNTIAPCQHVHILKKKTSFTLRDGRCFNNRKFSPGPRSRIRVCASPNEFKVRGTAKCSPYQPLYGPRMFIKI